MKCVEIPRRARNDNRVFETGSRRQPLAPFSQALLERMPEPAEGGIANHSTVQREAPGGRML